MAVPRFRSVWGRKIKEIPTIAEVENSTMGWACNISTAGVWFVVKHVDLGAEGNPPTNQPKCHHAFSKSGGKQHSGGGVWPKSCKTYISRMGINKLCKNKFGPITQRNHSVTCFKQNDFSQFMPAEFLKKIPTSTRLHQSFSF